MTTLLMSPAERAAWPRLIATLGLYVESLAPLTPDRAYQVLVHQDDDAPAELRRFSPRHVRAALSELLRDGRVQRVPGHVRAYEVAVMP